MRKLLALLLMLLPLPAAAGEIVGALSQNRVSLTANFTGSEILIFGAIRPLPDQPEGNFDIAVVIEGPRQPVVIWQKARRMGIWVNSDSVSLGSVPSFYAVATTAPLTQILSAETDARYRISPAQAIRAEQAIGEVEDLAEFTEALLRLRAEAERFRTLERWVQLDQDILFRANVRLPANLIEGAYTTRMYLLRDGEVVHQYRNAIFVRKEGLERWLYQTAYDQPWLYGFMALAIALVAGWGAAAVTRLLRW